MSKSKRGRHKSASNELDRSIRWLESLDIVKKVILGITESCRHKYTPGFIRPKGDVSGGFKANGYSGNGIVDLFIRVEPENIEKLKEKIAEKYP
jgi:hypothetical protein